MKYGLQILLILQLSSFKAGLLKDVHIFLTHSLIQYFQSLTNKINIIHDLNWMDSSYAVSAKQG
jgi:hypothetical protein